MGSQRTVRTGFRCPSDSRRVVAKTSEYGCEPSKVTEAFITVDNKEAHMGAQLTPYPLCPGILELRTTTTPIPDFQLGPQRDAGARPMGAELAVEYRVGHVAGAGSSDKGILVDDENIIYHKSLGIFGDFRCEISLGPTVARLTVNPTYHRLGRHSIGTVPSVGDLLEDIVAVHLLRNGYALLYCGGINHGGEVSVFIGPSNTGKTTTVLKLVTQEAAEYISEDIAITDGDTLYCCPFAISPVDDVFLKTNPARFQTWLARNIPLLDTVSVQSVNSISELLEDDWIALSGEISQVCLLSRVERSTVETDATKLLLLMNRGEFTYTTNQILLGGQYFGYDIDIEAAMEAEKGIIRAITRNNPIRRFTGGYERLYKDVKRTILPT